MANTVIDVVLNSPGSGWNGQVDAVRGGFPARRPGSMAEMFRTEIALCKEETKALGACATLGRIADRRAGFPPVSRRDSAW